MFIIIYSYSSSSSFFLFQGELCALGSGPGMECMPLRSPPGAYHYHVNDQTKSLQVNWIIIKTNTYNFCGTWKWRKFNQNEPTILFFSFFEWNAVSEKRKVIN